MVQSEDGDGEDLPTPLDQTDAVRFFCPKGCRRNMLDRSVRKHERHWWQLLPAFDYAYNLLAMKSPSEFVELSTAHARKQFEAMTAQTKELTELAQKVTTEIAVKDWRHGDTKESHKVA
jgi:hypothetical protein